MPNLAVIQDQIVLLSQVCLNVLKVIRDSLSSLLRFKCGLGRNSNACNITGKAVVIFPLVVEQHCVVYKISIPKYIFIQLISIDAWDPGYSV